MPRRVYVLLAMASGLALAGCSPSRDDTFPDPAKLVPLGKLPASWAVTGLDGKEVSTEDLRGKVVFINRWATWCGPCVVEMPSIQALYESLKDSDIAFVIVSNEKADKIKEFVKKKGWNLPIYVATEGLPPVLRSEYIPATFVVDSAGNIVYRIQQVMDWDTDAARRFLRGIR